MAGPGSTYAPAEIEAIAGWLREMLSAKQIAERLSAMRRSSVSRNAIISVIRRNKALAAIGLKGGNGQPRVKASTAARKPVQHLRAGNIAGKKEGRAFDPGFAPVQPKPVNDGISPHVYDGCSRHVALIDLRRRECRWPVNQAAPGQPHLFCAAATDIDAAYCDHHLRRAIARAA